MKALDDAYQASLIKFIAAIDGELQRPDATQDAPAFTVIYSEGQAILPFTEKDAAHEFEVSRPTVRRWLSGENAPHPAMRKHVYDWLRRQAEAALAQR